MTAKTPTATPPRWLPWLLAGGLLALAAGLTALFLDYRPDRAYVTYRYARNLGAGLGLVYNPGQALLVEGASPLWAVLLAPFGRVPLVGGIGGGVGMGLAALALLLMPTRREFRPAAAGAAALLLSVPVLWFTLGLDVSVWLGVALLGVAAYVHQREVIAAALLGTATLLHPETLVLLGVIVTAAIAEGRRFKPLALSLYAVMVLGGLLWLVNTFENPFALLIPPRTDPDLLAGNALLGLGRFAAGMGALSYLWVLPLLLAIPGALRLPQQRWAMLPVGWAGLHLVVSAALMAPVYPWSFAPVLPGVAVLAALGVEWLARRVPEGQRGLAVALAAVLLAGAGGQSLLTVLTTDDEREAGWQVLRPAPARERDIRVGEWLAANTPPDATVGVAGVGTGTLGYTSRRPLVAFRGELQPELADAYGRGDGRWWLAETLPAFVVLTPAQPLFIYEPQSDPWFTQTYAPVETIEGAVIYQRGAPPPPLDELVIGAQNYGEGIVLTGLGTDIPLNPLEDGRLARVRLTWRLEGRPDAPQTVSIRLQGRGEGGQLAAFATDRVDFRLFPLREFVTTYHTIEVAPGLPNGVYDVRVGVGPSEAELQFADVTLAKVPFPDAEFLGAVRGLSADYGEISLTGYRIARLPEGLEVLLIWQADEAPRSDYRFLLQLREPNGGIVETVEAQPKGGTYPTSAWDAGERVAEITLLAVADLPPGEYQVYAGLLNPAGERLLTLAGEDTVFVGLAVLE